MELAAIIASIAIGSAGIIFMGGRWAKGIEASQTASGKIVRDLGEKLSTHMDKEDEQREIDSKETQTDLDVIRAESNGRFDQLDKKMDSHAKVIYQVAGKLGIQID